METPKRPLLPADVTMEELSWLLDNHPMFHQFVEKLIANAEERLRRHLRWEKGQ